MTKISYNFIRKAEQNNFIEISSCQNLRFKELEGTSEVLHLSLVFTGEDSETQLAAEATDQGHSGAQGQPQRAQNTQRPVWPC